MAVISPSFEKHIGELLGELPSRSRSVLKRRYGLGDAKPMTLEAIGKKEGITRERVRQIEHDAIVKLRKSDIFRELGREEKTISDAIEARGGLVAEKDLLMFPEFVSVRDKKNLLFFLDLAQSVVRRKEDDDFHLRWHAVGAPAEIIERGIRAFAKELEETKSTHPKEEIFARLESHLKRVGLEHPTRTALESYVGTSKHIERNSWNEYGHIASPFVRPRGMREGAYVVLSRAKEPLHFRDIAKRIGEFTPRNVHVQTVHNELIKDSRFVLVGRGLYALREWGYEPGFIKDVLMRLLGERGAMTREEILEEVSKRRQVKPSTVFINLQNKKLFRANDNGTYTLIS